jgi:hypothetical protein
LEHIPARYRATCEFCQRELNTTESGVHQFTKGWVMNRAGGGGHGVSLPERELRFACGYCIKRRTDGSAGQTSMFASTTKEPRAAKEPDPTNASLDGGRLQHVCNVCGGRAPFGIGVSLLNDDLGLWYCSDHVPVRKVG